ncbi:MAG: FAD-dependent oxidoreductase [Chloroflexi bacterium]|nr:FAD-dependent oxidoreductase [Chloroflexota bacterium]
MYIEEPARRVRVCGNYDVVVAGGGIAGIAAAIAAARGGASVCLLEKESALGGLATLGVVTVWLPLCDGRGHQVIGGLGEELLRLSVADLREDRTGSRWSRVPDCWLPGGDKEERQHKRYIASFNPTAYLLALERLLAETGVALLYDTRVCSVRREDSRVTHLVVENKGGRAAIGCSVVVDATGDADVCHLAREATESLDTNVLAGWFYALQGGDLHLQMLTHAFSPVAGREGAEQPFFRGDDGDQVTRQIMGSRELIRQRLDRLREQRPHEDVQPVLVPTIACLRMTRRLVGATTLQGSHVHAWADDAIGLSGDWRKPGPVYAIPWGTLCGVHNRNLLAAGRCISADASVWDVTRVIPPCAVTGEAAGTGAAMAARTTSGDLRQLPVSALQHRLEAQGVLLDRALVEAP